MLLLMVREYPTLQRKLNKITKQIANESKRSLVKWNGATWAVSGGNAYNTPTLGSELLTDGGFENWTTATDLTSWTEVLGGTSTINRESSIVQSGTYSQRLDIDSVNSARAHQVVSASVGDWLYTTWWGRTSIAGKTIRFTTLGSYAGPARTPNTTWVEYQDSYRVTASTELSIVYGWRVNAFSTSIYVDNASMKRINLNSAIASLDGYTSTKNVSTKIAALTIGTNVGVVCLLDSVSTPANFLIAHHDGTNVKLEKCVAGTYTTLVTTAVTFVANATIEIRRPSGNTFQVWYNGVQRGTDQTVADTGIINNTLYGVFSTYSGNQLNSFTLGGTSYPFNF